MRVISVIFLSLSFIINMGCSSSKDNNHIPPPGSDTYFFETYLRGFIDGNKMTFSDRLLKENMLLINITGKKIDTRDVDFKTLCEKYKDTSYNRWEIPTERLSLCNDFSSLKINYKAEKEDNEISLSDKVIYSGSTPWPYIQSGYDDKIIQDYKENDELAPVYEYKEFIPIIKHVNELSKDDLYLSAPGFLLKFHEDIVLENCEIEVILSNGQFELRETIIL